MLEAFHKSRFLTLLVSIILLFMVSPIAKQLGWKTALLMIDAAFTVVFMASVYAVSVNRRQFIVGAILFVPVVSLIWIDPFNENPKVSVPMLVMFLVFFVYIIYSITAHVLRIDEVTMEQVAGTLCVYLLIGILWAVAYDLLEHVFPGSFSEPDMAFPDYSYFSFVTLTTLGYGDVLPVSRVARSFAVVEAIIGQFFLAVLVARQVGLHISSRQK
jgi:hypothetical protein